MGNITSNLSVLLTFHQPTQMGGPGPSVHPPTSSMFSRCDNYSYILVFTSHISHLTSQLQFEMVKVMMVEVRQNNRPALRQFLASLASSLVVFHGGACIGWTSSALPPSLTHTAAMVGASFCLATCLGNILSPLVARRLGQRRSLVMVGLPLLCVHWLLVTVYRLGNNFTLHITRHLTVFFLSSKLHLDHTARQGWGRGWLRTVAVPGSLLYPRYF